MSQAQSVTATRVSLTLKSNNAKTGAIPVSTTSATTCPDACPLKGAGCYADGGPLAIHWRAITAGARGVAWTEFTQQVASLPAGTLWRHNQAGDLPGVGDEIDSAALDLLVAANTDRSGFTYTHKPVLGRSRTATRNRKAVANANAGGFTVNLSANNLTEADLLADTGAGPVVAILDAPEGVRHDVTTPAGRKVATCPATYRDDVTCQSCKLCQRRDRKVIIGFPAHGMRTKAARAIAASVRITRVPALGRVS